MIHHRITTIHGRYRQPQAELHRCDGGLPIIKKDKMIQHERRLPKTSHCLRVPVGHVIFVQLRQSIAANVHIAYLPYL